MKQKLAGTFVLLLPLVITLTFAWSSKRKSVGLMYRGWTAAQWAREFETWDHFSLVPEFKKPTQWRAWLAKLGLPVSTKKQPIDLELVGAVVNPDADAVPVMMQLLELDNGDVRYIAAQSLWLFALQSESVGTELFFEAVTAMRFLAMKNEDPDPRVCAFARCARDWLDDLPLSYQR